MKEVYEGIVSFLKNYQERTHVKGYVLGISGGKDSTVVAKLLVDSIGKENVLGVLMPNGKQADIEDSYTVCDFLDINYTVVNIENAFDELIYQIDVSKITTVEGNEENIPVTEKALTNVPPRIRMTILYTIAQSVGYRVAGTSNASELFIGWGTFFAIHKALQDIGVTDVHLRVRHAIQKEPLVKLSKLYKTITITNSYKDWDKEELPNNIKVIKVYD